MSRFKRKRVALFAALALVAVALLVPATAPAKGSTSLKIVAKLHLTAGGSKSAGKATVTIGKQKYKGAKAKGSVRPPKMVTTFRLKGGSITTVIKNGKIVSGALTGTFSLKGTGRYANISGRGKLKAPVSTLVFTFRGKAKL